MTVQCNDILVNNAAIDPKVKAGLKWLKLLAWKIWSWLIGDGRSPSGSQALRAQVFGSRMVKRWKGGVILNIASDLSVISRPAPVPQGRCLGQRSTRQTRHPSAIKSADRFDTVFGNLTSEQGRARQRLISGWGI